MSDNKKSHFFKSLFYKKKDLKTIYVFYLEEWFF